MMKKLALALVLVALLPAGANALQTDELLSLVAMPLAVAAVAELTDVPTADLIDFVATLNHAAVPPAQFVEVVRYVPVALVESSPPEIVSFTRTRVEEGVTGMALATAVADRFRAMGFTEINVVNPPAIVVQDARAFLPARIVTRVAEVRRHPHGGPPGQLKKQLGVQTGAEVVHGATRKRKLPPPMISGQVERAPAVKHERKGKHEKQRKVDHDDRGKPQKLDHVDHDRGKGKKNDDAPHGSHGREGGKGKGKGKG